MDSVIHRALPTLCFFAIAFASACASGPASTTRIDEDRAANPPPARVAPSTDAVARTRSELQLLARDLAVLDGRLPSALSAVNFTVMRFPVCLDVLFEKYARLDLARREITLEEQDLRRALDDIVAGTEDGTRLLAVENRARVLRDRLAGMNAELAMLFADAMSQRPSCAPKSPPEEKP
jgi:hypothetical protein